MPTDEKSLMRWGPPTPSLPLLSGPAQLRGAFAILRANIGPHSTIDHPPILPAATWVFAKRYIAASSLR